MVKAKVCWALVDEEIGSLKVEMLDDPLHLKSVLGEFEGKDTAY